MSSKKEATAENTKAGEPQPVKKGAAKKGGSVIIYVGPTSKRLTRYASFTAGLPTHMEEHFKKCPALKKLFIPIEQFTQYEQLVKDGSSVEAMLYEKAAEYFRGGNE